MRFFIIKFLFDVLSKDIKRKVNKKKIFFIYDQKKIWFWNILQSGFIKKYKKALPENRFCIIKKNLPGSWYFKFLAKCVNCNGIYLVSALGGLRGAGGDVAPGPRGHKKARCNSHPTSDIMLALRKYGVTSRRNLTERKKNKKL